MTAINNITFSFFMIFSFAIEIVIVDGWNHPHEGSIELFLFLNAENVGL